MSANAPHESIELARERDFALGPLCIRPSSREVSVGEAIETLEPKVMQVLVALVRRRGSVVSRDELVRQCWDGRVVTDDAISRCIARLRRLSESHGGFDLETIPRIGYRLTERVPASSVPEVERRAESELVVKPVWTRRWLVGVAVLAAVGMVVAIIQWRSGNDDTEYRDEIVARFTSLVTKDQLGEAFTVARPVLDDARVRALPEFAAAWKQVVTPMRPIVSEAGATVYFKSYDDVEGEWIPIGVTPLSKFTEAPRAVLRIKVEKPGYRTGYFVVANPGPSVENEVQDRFFAVGRGEPIALPLIRDDAIPEDMVFVPHTNIPVQLPGWTKDTAGEFRLDLAAFAIDREEVTNRQYKEFIDAGGYADSKYWEGLKFESDGRSISWEDARKRFVDSTGRPGPAGWQLSAYPIDEAEDPVGGISWYEAAAYARFKGRQLPTIHHWARAALAPFDIYFNVTPTVVLASQFSAKGPRKTHDENAIGPWGTMQMAGNVREWIWNSAGGKGLALGGAWSDYGSDNRFAFTADRMQRLPQYGVRLMKALSETPSPDLLQPIELSLEPGRVNRAPVSNEAFEVMRSQFNAAGAKLLSARVEIFQESPLWLAEEVTLQFAGAPPTSLYIVRPRTQPNSQPNSQPNLERHKLQPIIFAPPQNCCAAKRPNRNTLEQLSIGEFVVNSGRALVLPIWMGSYERFLPANPDPAVMADRQRRVALAWREDLRVTLDYLETREDIDAGLAGYLSFSRGSAYNVLALALEDRIKAAVLVSGGIEIVQRVHPMIDLVNYAPRITTPVLMINGRFDHIYLFRESQRRLFDLLGTPADKKQHNVYETGHFAYPPNTTARDATDWFDKYLGPARH